MERVIKLSVGVETDYAIDACPGQEAEIFSGRIGIKSLPHPVIMAGQVLLQAVPLFFVMCKECFRRAPDFYPKIN